MIRQTPPLPSRLAAARASPGVGAVLMRSAAGNRRAIPSRQPTATPPMPPPGAAAAAETAAAPSPAPPPAADAQPAPPTPAAAAAAVRGFYDAYNARDLKRLETLLAEDVVYSDLVYPQPKTGRAAVLAWLRRVSAAAPRDLSFVIESLAAGEDAVGPAADGRETFGVGVKWHVALLEGKSGGGGGGGGSGADAAKANANSASDNAPIIFPFSRGCSYVEVDARTGLIVRVRDVVEPSSKPGDLALSLLGGLAPLIRAVGPAAAERAGTVVDRRADPLAPSPPASSSSISPPPSPPPSSSFTPAAAALWLFYAGYLAIAMLSDVPPGPPAFATQPAVLLEALHESVNLLWIAETMQRLGLPMLVPVVPSHPVSEATFNFAVTWAALFVPFMFSDARGRRVSNNSAWAVAVVFVTNLFLTPWMALREGAVLGGGGEGKGGALPAAPPPAPGLQRLPSYARPLGFFAAAAGALCVGWALAGRPEAGGDLSERWFYLSSFAGGDNRVFWAFLLDYALFSVWQASMLSGAPFLYRFVPFGGMAAWLMVRGGGEAGIGEETQDGDA